MSFEKSVLRLDEIIKALENGNATLEQSVALYQEGITLLSECKTELNNAELLVTVADSTDETN